jgi:hypothetical protein
MCASNDRKWAVCACCVIAALGLAIRAPADELAMWQKDFKDPPLALKTTPLWALNGRLTREETASQLKASRDISGFAGVAVMPITNTDPKYLTEGYFARYADILDISKELGMSVILYDDVDFPTGTAGGRMKAQFPADIASRLDKSESNVTGPTAWKMTLPPGIFMGAVAMNTKRSMLFSAAG